MDRLDSDQCRVIKEILLLIFLGFRYPHNKLRKMCQIRLQLGLPVVDNDGSQFVINFTHYEKMSLLVAGVSVSRYFFPDGRTSAPFRT